MGGRSVSINGQKINNFKSLVEYKNGEITISSKLTSIDEVVLRNADVEIKAICTEATLTQNFNYPVFSSSSNSSKKLGELNITYIPTADKPSIYINFDGTSLESPQPIIPPTDCAVARGSLILFQVYSSSDGWSNLGKGPWGENGWINRHADKLFGYPFRYVRIPLPTRQ